MDRIRRLKDSAGLFEHRRKQSDAFGYTVDFETSIDNFTADGIENEGQPKTSSCDPEN